jgi:hypothetical protein
VTAINAVGVDLSWTSTGIAWADRTADTFGTDSTRTDLERAHAIALHVCAFTIDADVCCIEAGVNNSHQAWRSGFLHGVVRHTIAGQRPHLPVIDCPPKSLKVFATGSGNADKTAMVVAARDRLGYDGTQSDEADSLWLRELGLHVIGHPSVKLPATHLRALEKVRLP